MEGWGGDYRMEGTATWIATTAAALQLLIPRRPHASPAKAQPGLNIREARSRDVACLPARYPGYPFAVCTVRSGVVSVSLCRTRTLCHIPGSYGSYCSLRKYEYLRPDMQRRQQRDTTRTSSPCYEYYYCTSD
eukprot:scaffold118578_cov19-Prasinocladus_malaysianus.AAC.1